MESHLLQMRGLKQHLQSYHRNQLFVASFTDAWIETADNCLMQMSFLSHLLQMRGLKLPGIASMHLEIDVASFTDAWIETKK